MGLLGIYSPEKIKQGLIRANKSMWGFVLLLTKPDIIKYMKNILIIIVIIAGLSTLTYFIGRNTAVNNNQNIPSKTNTNDVNTSDVSVSSDRNVLNLSGQGLTKAPDYIFNQTNLLELNLSNNKIGQALQSQVQNLRNLKVLNLSNNNFTGVPAEVGQLKDLEILNLSNNQLTGLPNEIGNLSKLKLLDLSGNNYSEIDLQKIKETLPSSTVIKNK